MPFGRQGRHQAFAVMCETMRAIEKVAIGFVILGN
jgi:hypothetical protein